MGKHMVHDEEYNNLKEELFNLRFELTAAHNVHTEEEKKELNRKIDDVRRRLSRYFMITSDSNLIVNNKEGKSK